jgi:hypothetical protein
MALLYPWATKEYLLWSMSLEQIILYYNLGIDIKYPKPDGGDNTPSLRDLSPDALTALRQEIRDTYGKVD